MAGDIAPLKKAKSISVYCQTSHSAVWQHFKLPPAGKDGQQLVFCNMCPTTLASHGGMLNMHKHIQCKHSIVVCVKVEEDREADSNMQRQKQRTLKSFTTSILTEPYSAVQQNSVTGATLSWLVDYLQPLNIDQGDGFQ